MNQYHRFYVCKLLFALMPHWGGSGAFVRMRNAMLRWAGVKLGKNAHIAAGAVFRGCGDIEIGDNVTIGAGVKINCFGRIKIGNNVEIGEDVFIQSQGEVRIGDNSEVFHRALITANGDSKVIIGSHVRVAHMVSLKTSHHEIDCNGECIAGTTQFSDIRIGDGTWICAGAIVIPGVSVGKKNVIAAGAVVTGNTEDGVLMAGVPARVKKHYFQRSS